MDEKPPAVMGYLRGINKSGSELIVRIAFPGDGRRSNDLFKWFGGFPDDAETRWFAIAPIDEKAAEQHMLSRGGKKAIESDGQKAIKGSSALCREPAFWRWLIEEQDQFAIEKEEDALEAVKRLTGVSSRRDYLTDDIGREAWFRLSSQYHKWAAQPDENANG